MGSGALDQSVGKADFDKRLPGDTESTRFLIDLPQQVHREVHVDPLDRSTWADRFPEIQVGGQIDGGVVHRVETGGGECSSP